MNCYKWKESSFSCLNSKSFNNLLTRPGLSPKEIEVCLYIKLCCKSEDDSEECSDLKDFYDEDDEPQDEHPSTSSTEKKGRELDLKLGRSIRD